MSESELMEVYTVTLVAKKDKDGNIQNFTLFLKATF